MSIVTDRQLIEAMENLQVVLSADGFGLAEQKTTKYELLVRDGPIQYGGFKLLNRQGEYLLPARGGVGLGPTPVVVNYQQRGLEREMLAKGDQSAQSSSR